MLSDQIDRIILESGKKDESIKNLFPPIEEDPLLAGLKRLADEIRNRRMYGIPLTLK